MTLTHARTLVPDLAIAEAEPKEDEAALNRLALWCLWCAPLVATDPPDGLFIDVTGSAHLFRGEVALLDQLVSRLRNGGFAVRATVADTPGAAWAMARFGLSGTSPIVPPGQMAAAIASLPVQALRLPAEIADGLRELGLERIAQLAALPRASLAHRFGTEALAARRSGRR